MIFSAGEVSWPNTNIFWRDQRVVVTGRRGVLCVGSFVVEKIQARGAAAGADMLER